MSVWYPDQGYNQPVVYPSTVVVARRGSYAVDVSLPNSYTGVQVSGDEIDLRYLRGMAQDVFVDARSATALYVENCHNTIGDWQNEPQYANSPLTCDRHGWNDGPSGFTASFAPSRS